MKFIQRFLQIRTQIFIPKSPIFGFVFFISDSFHLLPNQRQGFYNIPKKCGSQQKTLQGVTLSYSISEMIQAYWHRPMGGLEPGRRWWWRSWSWLEIDAELSRGQHLNCSTPDTDVRCIAGLASTSPGFIRTLYSTIGHNAECCKFKSYVIITLLSALFW